MRCSIEFARTDEQLEAWNRFVLSCPCASYYNTTNWLDSFTLYGAQTRCLLATQADGTVVGGAALVVFRGGPWRWIEIPHGPCISPLRLDVLPQLLDAIDSYAAEIGAMFVQASPFEASPHLRKCEEKARSFKVAYDPSTLDESNCGISEALAAAGFKPGAYSRFIVAPTAGFIVQLDVEDLLMSFRKGTRRDIRYSLCSDLVVRSASSLQELKLAYDVVKENAARLEYPVWPWPAFRKGIWPAIESNRGMVLLAEHHSEVVGTIVVLFGGRRAFYVMGGTKRLNAKDVHPAHLLHYLAMQETLKRGYSQYDLTCLSPTGVAQFKRGFRPTYYRLADLLAKVYRRIMARSYLLAYPHLKKHRGGIAKLLFTARSLLKRGPGIR